MPELPEVETIKNDLRQLVVGRTIVDSEVLDGRLVRFPAPEQLGSRLRGERIVSVDRRAKYLLLRLSSGRLLVVQLRVTGQLLLVSPDLPIRKSIRLILWLDDGRQLRLVDSSRLAQVHLLSEDQIQDQLPLPELGPEVNSPSLTLERFAAPLSCRHREIKPLLLDQRFIAGLGNIYVDEALFAARIHPRRRASSLTPGEVSRLYSAMRRIIDEAINRRGTTTRSYRDVRGEKGGYQEELKVVHKTGEPCDGCSGLVERTTVGGRETFYCPSCQSLSG